jgi:carbon monoxide dehydrogenase subunit G
VELTNEFVVKVPAETAWAVLTDIERVAPCMPGAELREIDEDEFRGVVKVKLGPITAEYRGKASFLELDRESLRAVLQAEGRETRGQGNAKAKIVANLVPNGDSTTVGLNTELSVTGRVAQFGRGVLADVSNKLLGQFVDCLEESLLAETAGSAPSAADEVAANDGGEGGVSAGMSGRRSAEPVDLLDVAGGSVMRRMGPTVLMIILVVMGWRFRRRHRHR